MSILRGGSALLGGVVLALALASALSGQGPDAVLRWAFDILGGGFIVLLLTLSLVALTAWARPSGAADARWWAEAGMQATNGIAALALTYTLLGISLGIESLAGQPLDAHSAPVLIMDLTRRFSMAFMTTVIGLPLSTLLRSMLLVSAARSKPVSKMGDPS
ncbi:MAG: hypothetical protein A2018_07595 [Alphaproteobacteria bacterium GWF2_58_20]|nr:MAG: hypothetical protein A2018_07595 [Alphaproteobacteria bacterium GWF2_58_20]